MNAGTRTTSRTARASRLSQPFSSPASRTRARPSPPGARPLTPCFLLPMRPVPALLWDGDIRRIRHQPAAAVPFRSRRPARRLPGRGPTCDQADSCRLGSAYETAPSPGPANPSQPALPGTARPGARRTAARPRESDARNEQKNHKTSSALRSSPSASPAAGHDGTSPAPRPRAGIRRSAPGPAAERGGRRPQVRSLAV